MVEGQEWLGADRAGGACARAKIVWEGVWGKGMGVLWLISENCKSKHTSSEKTFR